VPIRAARQTLTRAGSWRAGRCTALAALAVLMGSQGLPSAVAEGEVRTISLHHIHTGEDLTITYKRDGRYDEEALKKINHLLRDWRKDEEIRMDPRLIDVVWEAYRDLDAKGPIHVVCGYRSPATNAMLRRRSRGVAQFSQHMLGKAMDFFIPGANLEALREAGLRLQRGGVGFYPTSGSPFVHLDVGSVRMWPRMSHDQLARVFPDGRTVHVPSDGHPLKNYALALADIQKRGSSEPSQMSLDAARSAGIGVNLPDKPRRNLIAALLGAKDEDEDNEMAAAPAPAAAPKADTNKVDAKKTVDRKDADRKDADRKTVRTVDTKAAAIKTADAKSTATSSTATSSAATNSGPAPAAARIADAPSFASNVIASRGFWDAPAAPASAPNPPSARVELASAESRPAPALHPRSEERAATTDTTGAVTQWPVKTADAADRVPTEIALSYAAQARVAPATSAAPAAPVLTRSLAPALPRSATTLPEAAAAAQPSMPPAALAAPEHKPGLRLHDPWVRAVMLAPDLRNYLTTLAIGDAPDPVELVALMAKPDAVVAMSFTDDPQPELSFDRFSGSAVVFVNTVVFAKRTAALQ
jgi:uncharacterized protein YcbK (DUF882 family)